MLLDSHVVLDLLEGWDRTGPRTRAEVQERQVFVSAATTWELSIKSRAGRLRINGDLAVGIDRAGFSQLPILQEHTLRIGDIEGLPHADPFDRLLLTQARVEGLDFVTWDRAILAAGLPFVRDARD